MLNPESTSTGSRRLEPRAPANCHGCQTKIGPAKPSENRASPNCKMLCGRQLPSTSPASPASPGQARRLTSPSLQTQRQTQKQARKWTRNKDGGSSPARVQEAVRAQEDSAHVAHEHTSNLGLGPSWHDDERLREDDGRLREDDGKADQRLREDDGRLREMTEDGKMTENNRKLPGR